MSMKIEKTILAGLLACLNGAANAGFCEYVDNTYTKVSTGIAGAGVATGVGLKIAGVTAVAHSSGAAIAATASTGYVAGTLGALGTAAGVITAPVTLVVGGLAVASAGGAIAYCHYNENEKGAVQTLLRRPPNHGK